MEESKNNVTDLFELINQDEIARGYLFFKKLSEVNNPIKWLKILNDGDFLKVSNNPQPIEDKDHPGYFNVPEWEILPLLNNISNKIITDQLNEQRDIAFIASVLNEIIKGLIQQKYINIQTNKTIITLALIISDDNNCNLNEKNVVKLILKTLHSAWNLGIGYNLEQYILPYLIRKNRKKVLIQLLKIILSYRVVKNEFTFEKCVSIIGNDSLQSILYKYHKDFINIIGLELIKICCNKINRINKIDKYVFSSIFIPTIEESEQVFSKYSYTYQLVALLRDTLEEIDKIENGPNLNEYKSIIRKLFDEKNEKIFWRIGYYIIKKKYDNLSDIFWEGPLNPLLESETKHEVYELIKSNCQKFDENQFNKFFKWLDEIKDEEETRTYYNKKEWITAVEGLLDKNEINESIKLKINDRKKEYQEKASLNIPHPGYNTYFDYKNESDDFKSLVRELLTFKDINDFFNKVRKIIENNNKNKTSKYSKHNIEAAIVHVVKKKSSDFINLEIDKIPEEYLGNVLNGLILAFKENYISFENAVNFVSKSITKIKNSINHHVKNNVAWNIVYFIDCTLDNIIILIKENKINQNVLTILEEVIRISDAMVNLNKGKKTYSNEGIDLVNEIINTANGRLYDRLVSFLKPENYNEQIFHKIKKFIEDRLDDQDDIEIRVALLVNLSNLKDKNWVQDKIKDIFDIPDEDKWRKCLGVYLISNSYPLSDNTFYEKALDEKFNNEGVNKSLGMHVLTAYLNDNENKDKWINKLFDTENFDVIYAIVQSVYNFQNQLSGFNDGISKLFNIIHQRVSTREDCEKCQYILGYLSLWFFIIGDKNLEKYEDIEKKWHICFGYIIKSNMVNHFLRELIKSDFKDPVKLSILKFILEKNHNLIYFNSLLIHEYLSNLTQKGVTDDEKKIIKDICKLCLENKYFQFKEILDKVSK
ncbi:MAG: hypothetical protein Fur0023_16760 [Bacteroidia bacterium]